MWERIGAMVFKEVRQMARDPGMFVMMFMFPILQLAIFGFAINNDPRHLPIAIESSDNSAYSRAIVSALRATSYFDIEQVTGNYGEAEKMLSEGEVQFILTVPADFSRDLVRGDRPQLLLTVDATDPASTGPAVAAVTEAVNQALARDLIGTLAARQVQMPPVDLVLHRSFNPEGITSHNTVPGLLAIILSMTMVALTAMSVTRETEQGTMENLLATPLRPVEVMIGKIVPYFAMGLVQVLVVLLAAAIVFRVPFVGSFGLLLAVTLLFTLVSLALGFTLSTLVDSQVMSMQLSMLYLMPSILLSGFAFPFRGMPVWAQWLSELLPPTHYIRLVRGIMLKGWDSRLALPEAGILLIMLIAFGTIAVRRYRDTVA
ncbi:ABC transporter permease [Novosphingobium sp.]|uniref:ABC transporter permease n=1 Tax=Novosphingobium sp. TaxID=1874826 RepID=UPI0025E1C5EE|nr:ABC transporter permease [Novosphingobium sp.]